MAEAEAEMDHKKKDLVARQVGHCESSARRSKQRKNEGLLLQVNEGFLSEKIYYNLSNQGKMVLPGTRVARFFLVQHTKTGKLYHMTTKCTK
jgi:hypothetical protein